MRVALVSGLCIQHDAISSAVVHELRAFRNAGHEVRVFTQQSDRLEPDDVWLGGDPWVMQTDEFYRSADLVVFHFGIHYGLFNALLIDHPRAAMVVRFHNVTPPELLSGAAQTAAIMALDQLSIVDRADVVWSDSAHNTEVLLRHCDLPSERVRQLPLCVPMIGLHPPAHEHHDGITILAVGRFVRAKGLHDLIDAYAQLGDRQRERTCLRLVGDLTYSDLDYLEGLHRQVDDAGLSNHVAFEHGVTDEELHNAFSSSDVFVSASYHEGFGLPVIEAIANDCQVIVTDAGSLADTVGGCGEVIEVGDIEALGAAISSAIDASESGVWRAEADARRPHREAHVRRHGSDEFAVALLDEARRAVITASEFAIASPARDPERFARRHRRLVDALACPVCGGVLISESATYVRGVLAAGELVCASHGRRGVVTAFKPGFLDRDIERWERRVDDQIPQPLDLARDLELSGEWFLIREGLRTDSTTAASLRFDAPGSGAELRFLGVPHGGRVRVSVDGRRAEDLDLRRDDREEVIHTIDGLGPGPTSVRVEVLQTGIPTDVIVNRVTIRCPIDDATVPDLGPLNRGNPYPDRFLRLLSEQPADALVLDCGGGDRRVGDDRVVNLEYLDYELPDLYGDGLALPFADDTFDLVLSQAVLEHVSDPQSAVDEIVRILKPGGIVYFEVAFMQPLHAVPYHYMNVTPFGIEHLCRDLECLDTGTFGGLSPTVAWMGQLVGAGEKLGRDRFDQLVATLAELDQSLDADELRQVASAVFLEGRKPTD